VRSVRSDASASKAIGLAFTVLAVVTLVSAIPMRANGQSSTPAPSAGRTAATLDVRTLAGAIVFDHEGQVWVMAADGSDRTQLTTGEGPNFDAAWSPDGSRIAFRSHRDGDEEVYVMDADGSDPRNLSDAPRSDYSPAWSPDGSRIAFATDRDPDSGGNDIYVMDADGSNLERLTVGGGIDEYPSWSPDRARIAYACSGGRRLPDGVGDFEVCVMDADGSDQRQVTDAPGLSDHPAWSPDGRSIAFMTTRDGWPTLPDYVPLGYEEGESGDYEIYVMDADGGSPRNVTRNGREGEQFPAWSPDGEHLIFSRYGCLIVSTPSGSATAQLTPGRLCADGFPSWSAATLEQPG
jgi:Tol biopolymer transport system component